MSSIVTYSPYGSFELKAKYQRNFALATSTTVALVIMCLTASWIITGLTGEIPPKEPPMPRPDSVVVQIPPPPSIVKEPPQVRVSTPQIAAPKIGIPRPVADEEIIDDNVFIPSRDELAVIVGPGLSDLAASDSIAFKIPPAENRIPTDDKFIPLEIYPEFIYYQQPDYPRLAKQAGITGTVIVWVVVDEEGNVIDARVYKSSGTKSLDEAAVQAAYKNKFKPGIQNGRPVKVPVTYRVEFKLTDQ